MRFSSTVVMALATATTAVAKLSTPIAPPEGETLNPRLLQQEDEQEDIMIFADGSVDVIVTYKNDKGKDKVKKAGKGGELKHDIADMHMASVHVDSVFEMEKLKADDDILSVEYDQIAHALYHSSGPVIDVDTARRLQGEEVPYGISQVQADQLEPGSVAKKVCVIDTGYGVGHPDLPTPWDNGANGTDTSMGSWDFDGHSHGTHCAGTIGAIGDNGQGVTSVNPDPSKFSFHIGKGLSDSGSGSYAAIIEAMNSCRADGADIISMSLGGGYSTAMKDACQSIYDSGILIIGAAGNGGSNYKSHPASLPTVMSVAAVNEYEVRAGFSQYNNQVEIAGPGVSVKSTVTASSGTSFGYSLKSGTSMATPHVAGVAALVWSRHPTCSHQQIRTVLLRSAKDKGALGCDDEYGYGIVQAAAADDMLRIGGCEAGGPVSGPAVGGCAQPVPSGPVEPIDGSNTSPPTSSPTEAPTTSPTEATTAPPTEAATSPPTSSPTEAPTSSPTEATTAPPTEAATSPPTSSPTEAPTTSPTEATTAPPTAAATQPSFENPCGEGFFHIHCEVMTNAKADTLRIRVHEDLVRIGTVNFKSHHSNQLHQFEYCADKNKSVRVRFIDKASDSIYPGYWKLTVDGLLVTHSQGPPLGKRSEDFYF